MDFIKRVVVGLGIFFVLMGAAHAQDRGLFIMGPGDKASEVIRVYVSPAQSNDWGENLFPQRRGLFLNPFKVPLPNAGCVFDVRIEYTDGWKFERLKFDICAANESLRFSETDLTRMSSSAAASRDVYVMNGLDDFPREFYIVPAGATSWGAMQPLNRDWTPTTFALEGGHCIYHVKVVHKSRRVSYYPDFNACTSQVFTIKGSGVSADPLAAARHSSAPSRPAVHDKQIRDCISGTDPKVILEQCKTAMIMMAYTDEERPRIYAARGRAHRQLREYDEAIKWLTEAISIDALDANALNSRALAYGSLNDDRAAMRDLDAAIRINPHPTYFSNRALAANRLGLYEQAERDATAALALRSDYAPASNARGIARRQRGQHREAIADFTAAIALEPKNDTFVTNRAISWLALGELTEAATDVREALTIAPGNASALFVRAVIRLRSGDRAGSDADLQAAKALNPTIEADMGKRGVTLPRG